MENLYAIQIIEAANDRCLAKHVLLKSLLNYRKTSVLELLFNKVAGFYTCNFIKKRL